MLIIIINVNKKKNNRAMLIDFFLTSSGVFIVNFEHFAHLFLEFLLLTLTR